MINMKHFMIKSIISILLGLKVTFCLSERYIMLEYFKMKSERMIVRAEMLYSVIC